MLRLQFRKTTGLAGRNEEGAALCAPAQIAVAIPAVSVRMLADHVQPVQNSAADDQFGKVLVRRRSVLEIEPVLDHSFLFSHGLQSSINDSDQ